MSTSPPLKKARYQTKTVTFDGKELTLYSLDGSTWSTRKEELHQIKDRHENGRVTYEEIRSGIVQKRSQEESAAQETNESKEPKAKRETPPPAKVCREKKAPPKPASVPKPKQRAMTKAAPSKTKSKRGKKSKAA